MQVSRLVITLALMAGVSFGDGDVLYKRGVSLFKEDPADALVCFELAAAEGNAAAMVGAGHCYESGTGTEINFTEAIAFYERAMKQNSMKACEGLARIYASCPDPTFQDGEKAVKYALAVARGNPKDREAKVILASAYARNCEFEKAVAVVRKISGAKVDQNFALGEPVPAVATQEWLLKACDRGSIWALLSLGNKAREDQDWAMARQWYLRAAELGSAQGCLEGGILLWSGFGGDEDKERALELFLQAEEEGLEGATYWCGYAHCCLRRNTTDMVRGLNYFEQIEDDVDLVVISFVEMLGYPTLRANISGRDIDNLYQLAGSWKHIPYKPEMTKKIQRCRVLGYLLMAAEAGDLRSAKELCHLFSKGSGPVSPDPERAVYWQQRVEFWKD